MNQEEEHKEQDSNSTIENKGEEKNIPKDVQTPFWKKYFFQLLLSLLLVISIAWGYYGKKSTISKYEAKISALQESYEIGIKDLKAEHIRQLSTTLSLAVRSELINNNLNQVSQYFNQTLKMFDIEKVMLVDQKTGKVILSTNKKDEESIFGCKDLVEASEAITKIYDGDTYVSTPIMGLNSQEGVLVIQVY